MNTFKPGDVAVVEGRVALRVKHGLNEPERWVWADGFTTIPLGPVRPLVVIDPEDREQARRLLSALDDAFEDDLEPREDWDESVPKIQSALRSLVAPAKPEEPQGLGAVVEDADGRRWVRADDTGSDIAWLSYGSTVAWETYDEITTVRVLSEGVAS